MALEKYANFDSNRVVTTGGCVKLSLTDSNSTQLADHPCRKLLIIVANADDVSFSIGEDVSTANYAKLPQLTNGTGKYVGDHYLELNLSNTNKIRVKGASGDVVHYIYLE